MALTFDPHPAAVLKPGTEPPRLTEFATRAELLKAAGADDVVRLEPTYDLLSMEAPAFVRWCVERFHPSCFVEGEDFHFGKNRRGTVALMREMGATGPVRFDVAMAPTVSVALGDQLVARASSTLARWLIANRRMTDARLVLGRPYTLRGVVTRGDRLGRTIGFPTANLSPAEDARGERSQVCMLPGAGVYACWAVLADGQRFGAAVNVGARPTVHGVEERVEAHLLNVETGGAAELRLNQEYGWGLTLEFVSFVRDSVKFPSLRDLQGQLQRDVAQVRVMLADDAAGVRRADAQTGMGVMNEGSMEEDARERKTLAAGHA